MRNVIMIATDQQKVSAMGCVDASYRTPQLDRLAERSVRFTGVISTSAQCSPSRASWMTGKYPHQVGVNQIGHVLDPREWGIAKEFNHAGYETAYFGKWHLGLSASAHDFQITHYRTDELELGGANTDPRFLSNKDAVTTAMALNYLEDYQGDKPFFLKVCWHMPHPNAPIDQPFELIERYAEQFQLADMPIPDSFLRDNLAGKPVFQRERSETGESLLTEELVRRDAQRYRTMLSLMDWNLGRLIAKLEAKGLLVNTAILFTSDHGDMQGAHRLRLKGVLPYKELYNVPLILYVPGVSPSRKVIPDLVSSAAVPGTLLAAAGLEVPAEFEGGSLLPHLNLVAPPVQEHVFFEHYKAYWGYHPMRGVQTPDWKYVYYYEDDMEEMYDLRQDPDELVNVAGELEAETARLQLRQQVDDWWDATGGLSRPAIEDLNSTWGKNG
ncbi:sulfatase family protein [Paenibacillus aestuarii]|uniref:Sulfatase n=1 Tax=Paenibacillus aestuarii TaxID=516965 RepID=A0ABW0KE97_9BACL|nr:sulfatase-like hydrolase/transferase [Paenibacillus aestuarii]